MSKKKQSAVELPEPNTISNEKFELDVDSFRSIALAQMNLQKMQSDITLQKEDNNTLRLINKELKQKMKEMQAVFDASIEDRERVIEHKNWKIERLEKELRDIEKNAQAEREEYASKYMGLYKQSESSRSELKVSLREAQQELSVLEEFRVTKKAMDSELLKITQQQKSDHLLYQNEVHKLEQKMMTDLDRLQRQKREEMLKYREDLQVEMKESLNQTIQRTIAENEHMTLELKYQSGKIEKLIADNDHLVLEKKRILNELEIHEYMETQLSRKVRFYEHMFKKLQLKEVTQGSIYSNAVNNAPVPSTTTAFEEPDDSSGILIEVPQDQDSSALTILDSHLAPEEGILETKTKEDEPISFHDTLKDLDLFLENRQQQMRQVQAAVQLGHFVEDKVLQRNISVSSPQTHRRIKARQSTSISSGKVLSNDKSQTIKPPTNTPREPIIKKELEHRLPKVTQ